MHNEPGVDPRNKALVPSNIGSLTPKTGWVVFMRSKKIFERKLDDLCR